MKKTKKIKKTKKTTSKSAVVALNAVTKAFLETAEEQIIHCMSSLSQIADNIDNLAIHVPMEMAEVTAIDDVLKMLKDAQKRLNTGRCREGL